MLDPTEAFKGVPPKNGPNKTKNSPAAKGKAKGKGDKPLPPWMKPKAGQKSGGKAPMKGGKC